DFGVFFGVVIEVVEFVGPHGDVWWALRLEATRPGFVVGDPQAQTDKRDDVLACWDSVPLYQGGEGGLAVVVTRNAQVGGVPVGDRVHLVWIGQDHPKRRDLRRRLAVNGHLAAELHRFNL